MSEELVNNIRDAISVINDPHMGISIVEMGIVQDITVDGDHTKFKENMRLLGYSVIGEDSAVYKISADTMTLTAVIES